MKTKFLYSSLVVVSALALIPSLLAQTQAAPRVEFPAPSPLSTVKQRVGLTDVEIVYSRPGVKGRKIFGGLEAYNKVWRTGANASTKISFSTDVKLGGQSIPAGKYALYTIPGEVAWTVIVYKDLNLSSVANYNQSNDVARIKVTPVTLAESVETFTIDINDIRDNSATLNLIWEKTRVPVKIELDLNTALVLRIEELMASSESRKPYYQAASYYFENGLDLAKARKWIDAAVAERETYYIVHLQAKILAKQGEKEKAVAAAKRSTELAVKADGPNSGFVKLNADLVAGLQ